MDLIVEAATALGSSSPELARVSHIKQSKRFSDKIDYAVPLVPENLKHRGLNPIAVLYELFSEGIHSKGDDECTEIFDDCKTAFEYVVSSLKGQKERADEFAKAMEGLKKKSGPT